MPDRSAVPAGPVFHGLTRQEQNVRWSRLLILLLVIILHSVYSVAAVVKYMVPNCANEIPEALEDPDPAVLRGGRSGFHHGERRQRCQRHLHVLDRKSTRLNSSH